MTVETKMQPSCPYCESTLASRGNFCPSCGNQARCANATCGDQLEADAKACVTCGTLVGHGRADGVARGLISAPADRVNRITYSESDHSKQLDASLTNRAVESLSGTLGAMIGFRALQGRSYGYSPEVIDAEHGDHPLDAGDADDAQRVALPSAAPSARFGTQSERAQL